MQFSLVKWEENKYIVHIKNINNWSLRRWGFVMHDPSSHLSENGQWQTQRPTVLFTCQLLTPSSWYKSFATKENNNCINMKRVRT